MHESPFDPYAPPLAVADSQSPSNCFRSGNLLIVRSGALLPEICPLTGQASEGNASRKECSISWTPYWVYAAALLGFFPMLILIPCFRKRAAVTLSLSPLGKKRIAWKKRGALLVLAAGLSLFLTFVLKYPQLIIPGITGLMLSLWGIILMILARPLLCIQYKDGWFYISGCALRFLKNLPPLPEEAAKTISS